MKCNLQNVVLSLIFMAGWMSTGGEAYRERYRHMEFMKKPKDEGYVPLFHTNKIYTMIYATPHTCIKPVHTRRKALRGSNNFIGDFSKLIGFADLDNGLEVLRWQHAIKGKNHSYDPWYARLTILIPIIMILLDCIMAIILTPLIAIVLFSIVRLIWFLVTHQHVRNFLRRMWIENEVRKRKHMLVIYQWENRRKPKIRARLPYFLRKHRHEEIPEELLLLNPPSSSPLSSNGMDLDYFYAEFEAENRDAVAAQKQRMQAELEEALNPTPASIKKANRRARGVVKGEKSWNTSTTAGSSRTNNTAKKPVSSTPATTPKPSATVKKIPDLK